MDRNIFRYHNGEQEVYADPLEIQLKLTALLGDPARVVNEVRAVDAAADDVAKVQGALATLETFVPKVREVFGLRAFDPATGEGATVAATLGVWNEFQAWMAELKKNGT